MAIEREGPVGVPRDPEMSGPALSKLLAELAEESERTIDDESPYPPGTVARYRSDSVVQSVRLDAVDLDRIRAIAEKAGTPVSAIIRNWIVQGLAAEGDASIEGSIDRLAAELQRLKRISRAAGN